MYLLECFSECTTTTKIKCAFAFAFCCKTGLVHGHDYPKSKPSVTNSYWYINDEVLAGLTPISFSYVSCGHGAEAASSTRNAACPLHDQIAHGADPVTARDPAKQGIGESNKGNADNTTIKMLQDKTGQLRHLSLCALSRAQYLAILQSDQDCSAIEKFQKFNYLGFLNILC
jgi:hypothetical protein